MKGSKLVKTEPYLRSAEVARRLGVSGEAMRIYEAQKLMRKAA